MPDQKADKEAAKPRVRDLGAVHFDLSMKGADTRKPTESK